MTDDAAVFDRTLVRRHRARAAASFEQHDFLVREVAARLAERLADVKRDFASALILGAHGGRVAEALAGFGIPTVVQTDLAPAMLPATGARAVADEEWFPFADGQFDLVVSCLALHWVNDLPGALIQIRRALKPDGLFLAGLLGGATLTELRQSWLAAEAEAGGASPRVSPFADLGDVAGLLQRAGFALPVADADMLTVTYGDPLRLMRELRGMGEANAVSLRRATPTPRGLLLAAARTYHERFAGADGRVPATFQVLYASGWGPSATQPKPARRGSANARLADALGTVEHKSGDKAG
ncbi:MAG: methyltransferase domain-containing protein [Alphaproteobacteria bacterium]